MHTRPMIVKLMFDPQPVERQELAVYDDLGANKNNNNSNTNLTTKSFTIDASKSSFELQQQQLGNEQLRQDLARLLDNRLQDIGGPISAEWSAIKQFVSTEVQANLGDSVRSEVESLMDHPQLRDLVTRLRTERPDAATQAELLDKMTATLLPKVRRNHRPFLDQLNRRVSQMLVQLMRNDQLATVIDNERLLSHLFKLASSSEEESSRRAMS